MSGLRGRDYVSAFRLMNLSIPSTDFTFVLVTLSWILIFTSVVPAFSSVGFTGLGMINQVHRPWI